MPLAEPICIVGNIRICSFQNDSVKRYNRKIHLSKLYQIALATFTCFVFCKCSLVTSCAGLLSVLELGTVSSQLTPEDVQRKTQIQRPRAPGTRPVINQVPLFHGIFYRIEIVLDHTLSYLMTRGSLSDSSCMLASCVSLSRKLMNHQIVGI